MNIPADFIRDFGKHIEKKADLQRGDKEAWSTWFDRLEFYANLCNGVANKLEALDATKDEVVTAARALVTKVTETIPASPESTGIHSDDWVSCELRAALAALDGVRDATPLHKCPVCGEAKMTKATDWCCPECA